MIIELNKLTVDQAKEMIEKAIEDAGANGEVSVRVEDNKGERPLGTVTYTFTFERAK